ncbi:MAG: substrate-binding domain-containing protein [Magnetococcales bacterium]|nr:substrate-binding domain-containing protein [Magnetococcales bacterium]
MPKGETGAICCPFDDAELASLTGATMHPVALEPIMITTHPNNPIDNLTTVQARDMMRGRIDNWNQVGGPDKTIAVVMRPHCAQRPGHWKTILPLGEWKPKIIVNKFLKMITTVAKVPGAVGHLGVVLYDPKKMHVVKVDGVHPLDPDALKKGYPFYRPISLLTGPKPNISEQRLIDFLRTPEAFPILRAKHLVPSITLTP